VPAFPMRSRAAVAMGIDALQASTPKSQAGQRDLHTIAPVIRNRDCAIDPCQIHLWRIYPQVGVSSSQVVNNIAVIRTWLG